MKRKNTIRVFVTLLLVGYMIIGCTKKGVEGVPGQKGLEGEPAPPGVAQGPEGEPGTNDSEKGIKSSDWDTYSFQKEGDWWLTTIKDTLLTKRIVNQGAIIVYMKDNSHVTYELNYFNDDITVNADFHIDSITIQSTKDVSSNKFKYVIIPN